MAPIEFHVDTKKRLIVWRTAGRIAPDEVDKMRQELNEQANFKEGWNALLDLRSQANALSPEYMRQFAQNLPTFHYPVKWAIVVGTTVGQGMAHMFSILVEEKNVWARLFERIEDAEAWLADDDDPQNMQNNTK